MPFTDYLAMQRNQLLVRLCQVSEELVSVYGEIGLTRSMEFSKKAEMWQNPREDTITGRNNDVHYAAATETIGLIELEAQERALTEEKYLLIRLLDSDHAVRTV